MSSVARISSMYIATYKLSMDRSVNAVARIILNLLCISSDIKKLVTGVAAHGNFQKIWLITHNIQEGDVLPQCSNTASEADDKNHRPNYQKCNSRIKWNVRRFVHIYCSFLCHGPRSHTGHGNTNNLQIYKPLDLGGHPFMTSTRRGGGGQAQVDACGRGEGVQPHVDVHTEN